MELAHSLVITCSVLGVVVVIGSGVVVARAIAASLREQRDLLKFQTAGETLRRADLLLGEERYLEAAAFLRRAVYLDECSSPRILKAIRAHHEVIVGRYVNLADLSRSDFSAVVDLDYLLTQRHELLALLLELRDQEDDSRISRSIDHPLIDSPAGLSEELFAFTKHRQAEVTQELRINRTSIFFALERLTTELRHGIRVPQVITYH